MKVCHFIGTIIAGQYFVNLAKNLPSRDISLIFGSLHSEQKPAWLAQYPEVSFFNLNSTSRFKQPLAILKLAKILRQEKVDILQTHLFDGGLIGLAAAKLAGTPITILTRHHSDLVHQIGKSHHIALDRWMARSASSVVAVSQAARDFMIMNDHIDAKKIEVIHLGFDFDIYQKTEADGQKIRQEFGFTAETFVLGCVGSFFKTKGHRFLLAALKNLVTKIPNVRLLLLGSGDRTVIDQQINDLKLHEYVVFAGYRTDVPACLKAMDLVVHPSLSEAFCQVLIETMAAGTALIATDVGGAREVINDGENALLIPPGDSQIIEQRILELYKDAARRQQMALAGQKSVQKFSIEKMIAKQIRCYENLFQTHIESKSGLKGQQSDYSLK